MIIIQAEDVKIINGQSKLIHIIELNDYKENIFKLEESFNEIIKISKEKNIKEIIRKK